MRPLPLIKIVAAAALTTCMCLPAIGSDFEYFKAQSCSDLGKELNALQKAEKQTQDQIKSSKSKANVQAVVTTLLVGWPFWGPEDHGDATNILAEVRADMKMVTRAQKVNKCS